MTKSLTCVAGYWGIAPSRASTAGIGILFLPGYGAIAGMFAWFFARFRLHQSILIRSAAWLCIMTSLAVPALLINGGFREQAKNSERNRLQAENSRKIAKNTAAIQHLLMANPGHEMTALEAEIAKHHDDRTFLIPALKIEFVSPATLDRYSRLSDLGVVLSVARNQRTCGDTLDWIYHNSSYPPYFFDALAENKNTNADTLRRLYEHPEPQMLLGRSLSRNPSAPRDLLEKLADSDDIPTWQNLLRNPALDCSLLRKVKASEDRFHHTDDVVSRATMQSLEARLCAAN
jgi:hypothetical protein